MIIWACTVVGSARNCMVGGVGAFDEGAKQPVLKLRPRYLGASQDGIFLGVP